MIDKLNDKRRKSTASFHSLNDINYSSKISNNNKDYSSRFKESPYNFEYSSDYNTFHQKFHEYSLKNKEHQRDMYNIKSYHGMHRSLSDYEKREIEGMRIPFYPRNNNSYAIKNGSTYYDYDNKPLYKPNYYRRPNSPYSINLSNTEYQQDYYPMYLSEPNNTSNYHEFNRNTNMYRNFNYNIKYPYDSMNENMNDLRNDEINDIRNERMNDIRNDRMNVNSNLNNNQNNNHNSNYMNPYHYSSYEPYNIRYSYNRYNNASYDYLPTNNINKKIEIDIRSNKEPLEDINKKYESIRTNDMNKNYSNSNSYHSLNSELNKNVFVNSDEFDSNEVENELKNYSNNKFINEKILNDDNIFKRKENESLINDNNYKSYENSITNRENWEYQSNLNNSNNYNKINNEIFDEFNINNKFNDDKKIKEYNKSELNSINESMNINIKLNKDKEDNITTNNTTNNNNKNEINSIIKEYNDSSRINDIELINNNNDTMDTMDHINKNNKFTIHEKIISEIISDTSSDFYGRGNKHFSNVNIYIYYNINI